MWYIECVCHIISMGTMKLKKYNNSFCVKMEVTGLKWVTYVGPSSCVTPASDPVLMSYAELLSQVYMQLCVYIYASCVVCVCVCVHTSVCMQVCALLCTIYVYVCINSADVLCMHSDALHVWTIRARLHTNTSLPCNG